LYKSVIAIDGPAGSGKSTIAKIIAKRFNIYYLDTGAMYRAVAYKCIKENIDIKDVTRVKSLCESLHMKIKFDGDKQIIFIDDEDVSDKIRTEELSKGASAVATNKEVRLKLVEIQREFAQAHGCVMDGRDIGSFVLPDAEYKFYLTASSEERAKRRYLEYLHKGQELDFSELKKSIEERDKQDMSRDFAPLIKASNAIEIDTTGLDIESVLNQILSYIK
jgi:cytidylate kinase